MRKDRVPAAPSQGALWTGRFNSTEKQNLLAAAFAKAAATGQTPRSPPFDSTLWPLPDKDLIENKLAGAFCAVHRDWQAKCPQNGLASGRPRCSPWAREALVRQGGGGRASKKMPMAVLPVSANRPIPPKENSLARHLAAISSTVIVFPRAPCEAGLARDSAGRLHRGRRARSRPEL